MKEDVILVDVRENAKEIAKISEMCQTKLKEENNIKISEAVAIPTIAYQFCAAMVDYLNKKKGEGKDVSINFLQLFDIGITHDADNEAEKEGNFTPYLTPGQEMKLRVKSDEATEEE